MECASGPSPTNDARRAGRILWDLRPRQGSEGPSLLVLPHAGGDARSYARWADRLPRSTGLLVAQYPGRGSRFADDLPESVDDLATPLVPLLTASPGDLVVLGHGLGALVAFEVARRLSEIGRAPLALIGSACRAPFLPHPSPVRPESLDDEALLEVVRARGGTGRALLDEPELRALPSIRAEFAADDAYQRPDALRALDCPVTVLGGEDDPVVPVGDLVEWNRVTEAWTRIETVPGGHFYFDESEESTARFLRSVLSVIRSVSRARTP